MKLTKEQAEVVRKIAAVSAALLRDSGQYGDNSFRFTYKTSAEAWRRSAKFTAECFNYQNLSEGINL